MVSVTGAFGAVDGIVEMGGRYLDGRGIVGWGSAPHRVRMPRADKQAERLGGVAGREKFCDRNRVLKAGVGSLDHVEAVVLGISVMRDLADGGDLVAEGAEGGK